ncbi:MULTISPECIES: glycosyltransferase family 9 protein [unclassified Mesorhizobium]|uniref:glycosyltransferase family 9 protein n=1 Tax=unclassified Mesorhizobium TaxID=325217 RepID=UPI001673675E|nr:MULTISPECIES: glycosyltransferase family 9 protein [unclassified Mesorhizobium]
MGYGDQLMGSGLARGAAARGKRVALGDGRRILWEPASFEIYRGNPNLAAPGSEGAADLEWVPFYKGHRQYNKRLAGRWKWNLSFRAVPGEVFFDAAERAAGARFGAGFVVIEPQSAQWKPVAPNKDWGVARYQAVADRLGEKGFRVVQFRSRQNAVALTGVEQLDTASFRDALAVLGHARLYIGGEGGLHHGAAAVGIPAVVLFGGFVPPSVTGYAGHANLTGGAQACGSLTACPHCRRAMAAISVDDVSGAAQKLLISPQVGEMPGRAERGAVPPTSHSFTPPSVGCADISPTRGEIIPAAGAL